MSQRRSHCRRQFQLSGYGAEQKAELGNQIAILGGVYSQNEHFLPESTHIVCRQPSRSEKFLGGLATGKWLLTTKYIKDSYQHGRWLSESDYEWGPKWKESISGAVNAHLYLKAPTRWRRSIQESGHGPFMGWKVALLVDAGKKTVYKRLLCMGSADVVEIHVPIMQVNEVAQQVTHIFLDERFANDVERLAFLGVLCLKPSYIGDFMLLDPSPDPNEYKVHEKINYAACKSLEPRDSVASEQPSSAVSRNHSILEFVTRTPRSGQGSKDRLTSSFESTPVKAPPAKTDNHVALPKTASAVIAPSTSKSSESNDMTNDDEVIFIEYKPSPLKRSNLVSELTINQDEVTRDEDNEVISDCIPIPQRAVKETDVPMNTKMEATTNNTNSNESELIARTDVSSLPCEIDVDVEPGDSLDTDGISAINGKTRGLKRKLDSASVYNAMKKIKLEVGQQGRFHHQIPSCPFSGKFEVYKE